MIKILITDDDIEFTELLAEYLSSHGLDITIANDGEQGLKEANSGKYKLMVLDIMMPKLNGLEVLKKLTEPKIPTILLTAKTDDIDIILGLELGADDYIKKPANPRELLARINALLRRTPKDKNINNNEINLANFTINSLSRTCNLKGNKIILTGTEFDLLFALAKQIGKPVSKEDLSQEIFARELQPFDRSIDVNISRLRKKLEEHQPNIIKTIRGKGYQLSFEKTNL